jgi:hypothetical protein
MSMRLVLGALADELQAERRHRTRNLLRIEYLISLDLTLCIAQRAPGSGAASPALRGITH